MGKSLWNFWLGLLERITRHPVDAYLAQATDVADLERRLRQVQRGEFPFSRTFHWH